MKKLIKVLAIGLLLVVFVFAILFHIYNRYLFKASKAILAEVPVSTGISHENYATEIEQTTHFFQRLTKDWGLASVSVAVGKKDQVIWSAAFGHASLEGGRRLAKPDMPYRIHSVSKPITSTLVALAVMDGKISLTDTVQHILKNHFRDLPAFTIDQLLCHRAGIRHYLNDEDILNQVHYESAIIALAPFEKDTLLFQPGTDYRYSSYGYNVLGAVLEQVYDTNFIDLLSEKIVQPLKLKHTGPFDIHAQQAVAYYERDSTKLSPSPLLDHSIKYPSGGLQSTSEDLARFGLAILNKELLSDSLHQLFTSYHPANFAGGISYARGWEYSTSPRGFLKSINTFSQIIGWKVPKTIGATKMLYHKGGSFGGFSFLVIYPENEIVFAFLTNTNGNLPAVYKMPMMGIAGFFD